MRCIRKRKVLGGKDLLIATQVVFLEFTLVNASKRDLPECAVTVLHPSGRTSLRYTAPLITSLDQESLESALPSFQPRPQFHQNIPGCLDLCRAYARRSLVGPSFLTFAEFLHGTSSALSQTHELGPPMIWVGGVLHNVLFS